MTKRFCDLCGKPARDPGIPPLGVRAETKEQPPGAHRQEVVCTPQFVLMPTGSAIEAERHADLCRPCMVDLLKLMAEEIGRMKK